jgi:hypothetical protein
MASVLEIAQAISQIMSKTHDGELDDNDEPVKIGLKREEEVKITDRRVMDGFKVKLQDNKLIVNYQCEILRKEAHDSKLETNVRKTISEIVSFLKKEYKKITKNTLDLKELGTPAIQMYETSKVRNWLQAEMVYTIENMNTGKVKDGEELLTSAVKDWLELGKSKKGFH